MPGGLPEVTQRFDADASGYVRGVQEMIAANRELVASIGDAQRKLHDARGDAGGGNWGMFGPGGVAQIREFNKAMDEYSAAMKEASTRNAELNAMQAQTERLSKDGRDALNSLSEVYRRHGETVAQAKQAQAFFKDGLIDQANSTRDAVVAMSEHEQAVARLAKTYGTAQEAFAKSDFSKPLQYTADNARALNDALASTIVHADGVTRALSETDKIRARIMAGTGGYGGAQPSVYYNPFQGGGGGGIWPAVAQPFFRGGDGGGGGASWAARAAAAAGPPGGGWDKGTAGSMWGTVGTFLGTWLPRAHYVLMAANELAATLGPATVAAGMGALVGMQGGEQAVPRLKAVFSTAESLGDSLGMTAGQYMGLKTPALQNAQDLATGAAFEGIGAITNMMKAGAGGPFIQLGSNTDAMWSRMMANLTREFQSPAFRTQLGGLVTGGTDYLAQFGKIFGNIGHLFLNTAPNLPGVGGDYLSILQGLTGGLARGTGWLGPALGPLLAAEAGGRLGTPLVGGVGALLGRSGKGLAGLADTLGARTLSGLSATDAAALAGETGVGLTTRGGGLLARLLGRGGVGLATAGGFLGALTAPEIAVAGGMAYMLGKGITYQTPGQQWAGGLVSQVNQAGIAQSMPMAIAAMQKLSRVKGPDYPTSGWQGAVYQDLNNVFTTGRGLAKGHPGALVTGVEAGVKGFWDELFGGHTLPTNVQAANTAINQLSQGLVNAFGAGAQVSDQWKKLSGHAVGMGKAFDIATMAQLQLGKSFEQNGKLSPQAKQMIANLYAGYQPMNMNTGQFGAAVGAQTAMSGLQHTQLAAVNQSYDQLMQIVAGGATGSGAYANLVRAMPAGSGAAMRGFLSPAAAKAWASFASTTQPSVLSQLQSQTDWLRTAQTMGTLSAGQTAGMAEFLIGRALPSAKGSPAALAMLSTVAQQFGGPAFAPGTSAAQMYKQLQGFAGQGVGAGGYNRLMTRGTEGLANIGRDAQQFVQQIGSGIGGALAQGIAVHGATLQDTLMNSIGGKGGFSRQALGKYTTFLSGSGVPLKGQQDMITYVGKLAGVTPQQLQGMLAAVKKNWDIYVKTHGDTSGVNKVAAALAGLHNKTVTVTTINRTILQNIQVAGGLATSTLVGSGGRRFRTGMQTGGLVPGAGSGDIVPSMLEPGEAVIPRYLVPLLAPFLAAHRVPGFGGVSQAASTHFAAGGLVPHVLGFADPTISGSIGSGHNTLLSQYAAALGIPAAALGATGQRIGFTLIDGITHALSSSGARKIAETLIGKIGQELAYARNVASSMRSGLNLAGMDVTPGTGNGTVFEQMQSYLGSLKSFSGDLGRLRKGHLNKDLIAQLVAAGPVQGDALAQSILGDYGGIKGVNQLWAQIGKYSNRVGAQAAMAQYGGRLAPGLGSASVTSNHVTINVNAGRGSGSLDLTAAQIKQITEAVQAALLKQARRNNKTGLQLAGKGG